MVPVTATFLFNPKVWLLETVTLSRIKSPFSTTSVAASAVSSVTTGASSSAENASAVSSAGVSVTTGTSASDVTATSEPSLNSAAHTGTLEVSLS